MKFFTRTPVSLATLTPLYENKLYRYRHLPTPTVISHRLFLSLSILLFIWLILRFFILTISNVWMKYTVLFIVAVIGIFLILMFIMNLFTLINVWWLRRRLTTLEEQIYQLQQKPQPHTTTTTTGGTTATNTTATLPETKTSTLLRLAHNTLDRLSVSSWNGILNIGGTSSSSTINNSVPSTKFSNNGGNNNSTVSATAAYGSISHSTINDKSISGSSSSSSSSFNTSTTSASVSLSASLGPGKSSALPVPYSSSILSTPGTATRRRAGSNGYYDDSSSTTASRYRSQDLTTSKRKIAIDLATGLDIETDYSNLLSSSSSIYHHGHSKHSVSRTRPRQGSSDVNASTILPSNLNDNIDPYAALMNTTTNHHGNGWSSIRARDMNLDTYSLHGKRNPQTVTLANIDQHTDRATEVENEVRLGAQEFRKKTLDKEADAQNMYGIAYRLAESEHPPGELMNFRSVPRHVQLEVNSKLDFSIRNIHKLSNSMKKYIAYHIKNVYFEVLRQNADDLQQLPNHKFKPGFLTRQSTVSATTNSFGMSISRFGFDAGNSTQNNGGVDQSRRSLSTEFPLLTCEAFDRKHPYPVTLDALVAEYKFRNEPDDAHNSGRSSSWGLGISRGPNSTYLSRKRRKPIAGDEVPLWREKAALEAFLWAGPEFSTSAAVAAGGRQTENSNNNDTFDVKGYVLNRLRILGESNFEKYLGDEVAYGTGLGRFFSTPDPALSLLPTDAQIIWHYAVTLFDALIADAAIPSDGTSRIPIFKIYNQPPSVLNEIFRDIYVQVGPIDDTYNTTGLGGFTNARDPLFGSPVGNNNTLFSPNRSVLAPTLQQSVRFKLHCVEEVPRMKLTTTVDGVPVDVSGGSLVASSDLVPRCLGLFASLQLHEAKGLLWVHKEIAVNLKSEFERMCNFDA